MSALMSLIGLLLLFLNRSVYWLERKKNRHTTLSYFDKYDQYYLNNRFFKRICDPHALKKIFHVWLWKHISWVIKISEFFQEHHNFLRVRMSFELSKNNHAIFFTSVALYGKIAQTFDQFKSVEEENNNLFSSSKKNCNQRSIIPKLHHLRIETVFQLQLRNLSVTTILRYARD